MEKGEIPENANEHCPGPQSETAGKSDSCAGCPNQEVCATAPKGPDPDLVAIAERMSTIKHKILVLSRKGGGVGKSTFSAQLSFALAGMDHQVGLMDIDICGPSMPKMLGLEGHEIHQSNLGWSPVYVEDNLGVMSIGFMLPYSEVFDRSGGGADRMCREMGVPYLGSVPLDPQLCRAVERGKSVL